MTHYIRHEVLIFLGLFLFIGGLLNATGIIRIHSDYFWALGGLTLIIEGYLERRESSRLKRILRKEPR